MLFGLSKTQNKTINNYWNTGENPVSILRLPTLKLLIDHAEANEDGYQGVKLKHFLCEKGYIVNHVVEIVKFHKHYGNTISEASEAAVNVHADERVRLLLDVSQILNCNVLPDSMEIAQCAAKLKAFQKLFNCSKETAILNGVTSEDVK